MSNIFLMDNNYLNFFLILLILLMVILIINKDEPFTSTSSCAPGKICINCPPNYIKDGDIGCTKCPTGKTTTDGITCV